MWLQVYDRKNQRTLINLEKVTAVEAAKQCVGSYKPDAETYRLCIYSGPKILWIRTYIHEDDRDYDYNKVVDMITNTNMVADIVLVDGDETYERHNIDNDNDPSTWLQPGGPQAAFG